ncbi:MAG: hypothetical protein V3U84_12625 [Thiotrichaceae bacterium]
MALIEVPYNEKKELYMRLFFVSMMIYGIVISSIRAESGVLDINWSELNSLRAQTPARRAPYPEVLSKGVSNVTLPVYLPASHAYDKNMLVVADNNFYTITLFLKEATLIVSGDRTYQQSSEVSPQLEVAKPSSSAILFSRAEGMMTTSFNRFGANYSLELECDNPDQDSRCLQEHFLKGVYQALIMVGGHS